MQSPVTNNLPQVDVPLPVDVSRALEIAKNNITLFTKDAERLRILNLDLEANSSALDEENKKKEKSIAEKEQREEELDKSLKELERSISDKSLKETELKNSVKKLTEEEAAATGSKKKVDKELAEVKEDLKLIKSEVSGLELYANTLKDRIKKAIMDFSLIVENLNR